MSAAMSPFPLDGGRAGDGGDFAASTPVEVERGKPTHAPGAIARARRLRREMTVAERALWSAVRKLDLSIRRQAPIRPYVADFAHHGAKLVIEVDGYYHSLPDNQARDAQRDAWLASQGYSTLRLSDREVLADVSAVVQLIETTVSQRLASSLRRPSPPTPALPPSRGKGEL